MRTKSGQAKCEVLWKAIADRLTWNQYLRYDSMHKGDLSYKTKALIVLKITKDEETLALAHDLLYTYRVHFEPLKVKAEMTQLKDLGFGEEIF